MKTKTGILILLAAMCCGICTAQPPRRIPMSELPIVTARDTGMMVAAVTNTDGVKEVVQMKVTSDWDSLDVNTGVGYGQVTGTLYYKKNYLSNTVHIRGVFVAADAAHFYIGVGSLYSFNQLPDGFRPAHEVIFTTCISVSSLGIKDQTSGGDYIKFLWSQILPDGNIKVQFMRPFIAAPYTVQINAIIPLD